MATRLGSSTAKEFLIQRIVAEARSEGVDLSEVERKMLYFTESAGTSPDLAEVSADFDRNYDQPEYEAKVASLICNLIAKAERQSTNELAAWDDAVLKISDEDHYLLVMIAAAGTEAEVAIVRPKYDRLKLFATAAAIVIVLMAIVFIIVPKIP